MIWSSAAGSVTPPAASCRTRRASSGRPSPQASDVSDAGRDARVLELRAGQITRCGQYRDGVFVASQRVDRVAEQQGAGHARVGVVRCTSQALARGVVAQHQSASGAGQQDAGVALIVGLDPPGRHAEEVVGTELRLLPHASASWLRNSFRRRGEASSTRTSPKSGWPSPISRRAPTVRASMR